MHGNTELVHLYKPIVNNINVSFTYIYLSDVGFLKQSSLTNSIKGLFERSLSRETDVKFDILFYMKSIILSIN